MCIFLLVVWMFFFGLDSVLEDSCGVLYCVCVVFLFILLFKEFFLYIIFLFLLSVDGGIIGIVVLDEDN